MAGTLSGINERYGYDIASELYGIVTSAENHAKTLYELIGEYAFMLGDDELNETADVHVSIPVTWELMGPALEKLCQRSLSEEEFYAELWKLISDSGLFADDEERVSALFCVLVNPRIPYLHFDIPTMSDEEFNLRRESLSREIRALVQVVHRSFPQRTQEALAALSIIEKCDSKEDKAVAMAMLLSSVRDLAVR